MNVIISNVLNNNYHRFVVVNSFKEATAMDTIDYLIIHKFEGVELDACLHISNMSRENKVKHFIYITEVPEEVVSLCIKGVGGSVYDDEFYFDDESELEAILNEQDSNLPSVAEDALHVLEGFVDAYNKGEEYIKAPVYVERVKSALTELFDTVAQQEFHLVETGKRTLAVFDNVGKILKKMQCSQKSLELKVDELQKSFEKNTSLKDSSFNSGISFYPSFTYTSLNKVLLIREHSHCRYLTSFCLWYVQYLKVTYKKRVKLIFVHQKGKDISAKYLSLTTSINQDSSKNISSLYANEVLSTYTPTKEILNSIFEQPCDIFIVVDRLYGAQDIVTGKVIKVNAVSGKSDLKRFNIEAKDTIFPIDDVDGGLLSLKTIKNYQSNIDLRFGVYTNWYGNSEKEHRCYKLDSMIVSKEELDSAYSKTEKANS